MSDVPVSVEWCAPCSRDGCDGTSTWRSVNPAVTAGVLTPASEHCPSCDRQVATFTEPLPEEAPKVATALSLIARRMLGGTG